MPPVHVHGYVAPGFGAVADEFQKNFTHRGELGASFCVYQDGERLVDIWGGITNPQTKEPWRRETISTLFSSTKGLAALSLLMLADRGDLDYDAPVSKYWPKFGRGSKAEITVRTLLNHRSGLIAFDRPLRIADFAHDPRRVIAAMEELAPLWKPGTRQGYHGVTFGTYAGELFRQITKRSMGSFLADEVAAPLAAEVHLGYAGDARRVARMMPSPTSERLTKVIPKALFSKSLEGRVYRSALRPRSITGRAFAHPADLGATGLHNYNTAVVRRLELPWANGLGNARGLARIYGALARGGELDGVRLVKPETLTPLRERQSWTENDAVLQKPLGFAQGFIKEETKYFSPNPEAFGHPGAGGVLGFADPVTKTGIGYVMNKMTHHIRSPRAYLLCHALYRCLSPSPAGGARRRGARVAAPGR